jgi:3-methyladenine DNA glycosylase AlkD
MNTYKFHWQRIKTDLEGVSTTKKAESSRRFFPQGINCIGATASDIKLIIHNFQTDNDDIKAIEMLAITEYILRNAEFSEEILVAFGLINKFIKSNYDDDLMLRFEFWLENYAINWSHVDDLCIKTIYQFLLTRPHLIEKTNHWAYSKVSWCRRASNVVWVKFVKRKIGKSIYYLNKELVFKNCYLLIHDKDEFVQKSIGWLLKATSLHHQDDVIYTQAT